MNLRGSKRSLAAIIMMAGILLIPVSASSDMFGADVTVLVQILAQTLQELSELQHIFSTGEDQLNLLKDINQGIRDGLKGIQILNPRFNPGQYGNLSQPDDALRAIQDLYGLIPQSADSRLQESQDQSVAESLAMHGDLFRYADQVDAQSQRMLAQADVVNPQGAAKLQAQSLAVLIGVETQLLRTNSAMLKLMAENLALSNRREKLNSEQFRNQYDSLGSAFDGLPQDAKLPTLDGAQ